MPTEARAALARKALDLYLQEHTTERRWRYPANSSDVSECDVIDLMTDLLLLVQLSGHDPCSVLRKTQVYLDAEIGHRC